MSFGTHSHLADRYPCGTRRRRRGQERSCRLPRDSRILSDAAVAAPEIVSHWLTPVGLVDAITDVSLADVRETRGLRNARGPNSNRLLARQLVPACKTLRGGRNDRVASTPRRNNASTLVLQSSRDRATNHGKCHRRGGGECRVEGTTISPPGGHHIRIGVGRPTSTGR